MIIEKTFFEKTKIGEDMRKIKFLFKHSWKMSKELFLVIGFKSLFSAIIPLLNIAGLGIIIDALLTQKSQDEIIRIIIIFILLQFAINTIRYLLGLWDDIIQRKVSNATVFNFMKNYLYIDYHHVQDSSIDILRRKAMGVDPGYFISLLGNYLVYIIQITSVIYIFASFSPMFIVILILTSSILVLLTFITRNNEFNIKNSKLDEDRQLNYLYNVMTNYRFAKEVRINDAERYVFEKYKKIHKKQNNRLNILYKKIIRIGWIKAVVMMLQTASMYIYFSYLVYKNYIGIAEYTVLFSSASLFLTVLISFFDNTSKLKQTCNYVDYYLEYENMINNKSIIYKSNQMPEQEIRFENAIFKFENVSFKYPNSEKEVLNNINMEINKGEKIGIVGLNGSGKTTFVKLLTRLYDPTEGRITVNGIDIKEIPYQQYINNISTVLQDYFIFAYSIKENIVFDKEYNEKKLNESLVKSGFQEHVASLVDGVETICYKKLYDNGVELSGGQAQRLALARAVYKDSSLLILDEPTSSLDPLSEYEFYKNFNNITQGKTTIFISHRLSSTKFCDKIIVFNNGEIVETGSHQELINKKGLYCELFNAQAQYYLKRGVKL